LDSNTRSCGRSAACPACSLSGSRTAVFDTRERQPSILR
jgi:hypothetical protein